MKKISKNQGKMVSDPIFSRDPIFSTLGAQANHSFQPTAFGGG